MYRNVAIIGGGAAGCFCAIELKRRCPEMNVCVYESATKLLAKVAVTGGGRCNLTNSFRCCRDERGRFVNLQTVYPRGDKLMRKMLHRFSNDDVMEWFEREGVRLLTQEDECVFPVSQDAMEIVDTLTGLMRMHRVEVKLRSRVEMLVHTESGYVIQPEGKVYDAVVVTTGGSPKMSGMAFLDQLNIDIVSPVPSLFTLNIGDTEEEKRNNEVLMGTVVENVTVSLAGTKHRASGAILLTHWGVSGPAILKLSAYAARDLKEKEYKGTIAVNWFGDANENDVRAIMTGLISENMQKSICNVYPRHLSQRHWMTLLDYSGIPHTQKCNAMNKKQMNKLVACLTSQQMNVTGRCHWKEEFVTCGGVALTEINMDSLESKRHEGLFFAGEVLDVDAITGGFNLQAAWSMAHEVAKKIVIN